MNCTRFCHAGPRVRSAGAFFKGAPNSRIAYNVADMANARLAVTIAVVAGLVLGVALLYPANRSAPEITFTLIDGKKLSTAQLRGGPALVTFWATTCSPCIEEIPELNALYEELAPQGFNLVAVAVREDPPARVLEIKKQKNISYPIALDLDGSAAKAFDVQFIPRSFLLDANGNVILKMTGKIGVAELRTRIDMMLEKKK